MFKPRVQDLPLQPLRDLLLEAPARRLAPGPVLPRINNPPQSTIHGLAEESVEDAPLPCIFGPFSFDRRHGLEHAPAGLH